jgi:hypothetical protein
MKIRRETALGERHPLAKGSDRQMRVDERGILASEMANLLEGQLSFSRWILLRPWIQWIGAA